MFMSLVYLYPFCVTAWKLHLQFLLVVVVLNLSCSETESDPRIDSKAGKVNEFYDQSLDETISDDQNTLDEDTDRQEMF